MTRPNTLLLAFGGNALIRKGQIGTIEEQLENLKNPMHQVGRLSPDYRLILTHGNGPQVGDLLNRQECCHDTAPLPLEILVAQTQGQIGYMIESTLDAEISQLEQSLQKPLVSLISYVVVDKDDPAFDHPTKPIGPVLDKGQILDAPYPVAKTAKGYRRVVASPTPVTIVEKREIQRLIQQEFIITCCGGGGIPVIREGRRFCGVDAVIDKDLASACLAREVGVDIFVIATDVDGVYENYGTPDERLLQELTINEAEKLLQGDTMPAGSMRPKIKACVEFVKNGGKRAVIGSINAIETCVKARSGTVFVP